MKTEHRNYIRNKCFFFILSNHIIFVLIVFCFRISKIWIKDHKNHWDEPDIWRAGCDWIWQNIQRCGYIWHARYLAHPSDFYGLLSRSILFQIQIFWVKKRILMNPALYPCLSPLPIDF